MFSLSSLPWRSIQKISTKEDETLIVAFDTHWVKYIVPVFTSCILLGIALISFYLSIVFTNTTLHIISFVIGQLFLIFTCHWFFYHILSESMQDVVITNKRFIFLETRLLKEDSMHEINLKRVRAVDAYQKDFIQNILHYGSLWFDTGGSSQDFGTIVRVPYPHKKVAMITDLLQFN